MPKRQIPPYLAYAASLYRHNRMPDNSVFLHVGQGAWHEARNRQCSGNVHGCLPGNEDPWNYTWPVARNDVIVKLWSDVNGQWLRSLTECLLNAGATSVLIMRLDFKCTTIKPGDL